MLHISPRWFFGPFAATEARIPYDENCYICSFSCADGFCGFSSVEETCITLSHNGAKPSVAEPVKYFTGTVRIAHPFQGSEPAKVGGATVTFEPSAHTGWHTHPLGQTWIFTAGLGRIQEWGRPARDIRPGDVV